MRAGGKGSTASPPGLYGANNRRELSKHQSEPGRGRESGDPELGKRVCVRAREWGLEPRELVVSPTGLNANDQN